MLTKLQSFFSAPSYTKTTILSSYQQLFGPCYFFTALGQSLTSRMGSYMKAVGRSENPGVPLLFGGPNLPKSVRGMPPPAPPGTTLLPCIAGIKGPWVSNEDNGVGCIKTF